MIMQVILGSSFLVQYHWHWYSPVFSHVLLHKTHASLAAPTYHHLSFLAWTSPTIVGATGPLCRLDGHYKGQLRLGKTSRLRKIILYLVENSTAWRLYPIFGHTGEWQDNNPRIRDGDCHELEYRQNSGPSRNKTTKAEPKSSGKIHQTMVGSWWFPHISTMDDDHLPCIKGSNR